MAAAGDGEDGRMSDFGEEALNGLVWSLGDSLDAMDRSRIKVLSDALRSRSEKAKRLRKALEFMAESDSVIDHDGLWGEQPAHGATTMWEVARAALEQPE
jgi:hypothetical protein